MGFFSWTCPCCGQSIRGPDAVNRRSAWMNHAVACFKNGSRIVGDYDGYGRIDERAADDDGLEDGFTLYHRACWEVAGKPEYAGDSSDAKDQGFFVGDYHPKKPRTPADWSALRAEAGAIEQATLDKLRTAEDAYVAELQAAGQPVPDWFVRNRQPGDAEVSMFKGGPR